jgi:hypothetical protein
VNIERANTLSEIRAEILNENSRGLVLINGGGAVSIATWLQAVWDKDWAQVMLQPQLVAICVLLVGVAFAVASPLVRFISFFHPKTNEPRSNPWWWANIVVRSLSLVAFVVGMGFAVAGAWCALPHPAA